MVDFDVVSVIMVEKQDFFISLFQKEQAMTLASLILSSDQMNSNGL